MNSNSGKSLLFALLLMVACPGISWSEGSTGLSAQPLSGKQPPRVNLSRVARHVISRGDDEQREFVLLALDAMINAYSQVLQHSTDSRPRMASGWKRQMTWEWATSRVISSLVSDERKIETGAPFTLYVDQMQQIMVLIEGRVLLVSGPHTVSQSYFEQQIIDFYCLTRDCSWLNPKPKLSRHEKVIKRRLSRGVWHFQQETGPVFVIGGLIYFEFPDFDNKEDKTRLSYRVTQEVKQLVAAVHKLNKAKQTIDWPLIMSTQPKGKDSYIKLMHAQPEYDVKLSELSRLSHTDWMRLVSWLESDGFNKGTKLKIKQLTHML